MTWTSRWFHVQRLLFSMMTLQICAMGLCVHIPSLQGGDAPEEKTRAPEIRHHLQDGNSL